MRVYFSLIFISKNSHNQPNRTAAVSVYGLDMRKKSQCTINMSNMSNMWGKRAHTATYFVCIKRFNKLKIFQLLIAHYADMMVSCIIFVEYIMGSNGFPLLHHFNVFEYVLFCFYRRSMKNTFLFLTPREWKCFWNGNDCRGSCCCIGAVLRQVNKQHGDANHRITRRLVASYRSSRLVCMFLYRSTQTAKTNTILWVAAAVFFFSRNISMYYALVVFQCFVMLLYRVWYIHTHSLVSHWWWHGEGISQHCH